MAFDGNLAWKQATATMAANRELVLALAGVFFFLPSFAMIMLIKQPQVAAGTPPEKMLAILEPFILSMAPWFIIGSVVQTLGQATLIELFGHGGRATVGEALRKSLGVILSYIAVQLLTGFMMTSVLMLAMTAGSIVSPVLGVALGCYLVALAYGRLVAAGPVVVLERRKNPIAALVRAAQLSRGHTLRLGNFLFLLAMAFFFAFFVLTVIVGIVAALTMGEGRAAEILSGFFSSAMTALGIAYFAAIAVAAYRQLAGRRPEQARLPFD